MGALSWLSKETRPDLAGRVALLQQSFPEPKVKDLIEANAITKEAQKTPESGIRIMPIPTENLRIGVATGASCGNARDLSQENQTGDYWEETETSWIRHHVTPRRTLFHPGMSSGPDLHQISPQRQIKIDNQDQVINDVSTTPKSANVLKDDPWTGRTTFFKQPPGEPLKHEGIRETFLQMMNCSSFL